MFSNKSVINFNKKMIEALTSKIEVKKDIVNINILKADYRNQICKKCPLKNKRSIKLCKEVECSSLIPISINELNTSKNEEVENPPIINKKNLFDFKADKDFSLDFIFEEVREINKNNIYIKDDIYKPSSLVILQYLSLFMLPLSIEGTIKDIHFRDIANFLKCDIATVRKNSIILEEIGLISFNRTYIDTYDLRINNYSKMFSKECEEGFLKITSNSIKKLIDLRADKNSEFSINLLKTFLLDLKACDNVINNPLFNIKSIKKKVYNVARQMPSYIYRKKVLDIYNTLKKSNLLNIDIDKDTLKISFSNENNGKFVENVISVGIKQGIKEFYTKLANKLYKLNLKNIFIKEKEQLESFSKRNGLTKTLKLLEGFLNDKVLINTIEQNSSIMLYLNTNLKYNK